jgi:hypothetical protein
MRLELVWIRIGCVWGCLCVCVRVGFSLVHLQFLGVSCLTCVWVFATILGFMVYMRVGSLCTQERKICECVEEFAHGVAHRHAQYAASEVCLASPMFRTPPQSFSIVHGAVHDSQFRQCPVHQYHHCP